MHTIYSLQVWYKAEFIFLTSDLCLVHVDCGVTPLRTTKLGVITIFLYDALRKKNLYFILFDRWHIQFSDNAKSYIQGKSVLKTCHIHLVLPIKELRVVTDLLDTLKEIL